MGGSTYSRDDSVYRSTLRSATAKIKGISVAAATFAYDDDIKTGRTKAAVHASLSPKGVKIRESRDSKEHAVTVPIILTLDTTGSMASIPEKMIKELPKLMGHFIDDKASGKKYLGDGYPAIMVSAVDDYDAQRSYGGEGALQVGQFESGIEIDDNLSNLWITYNGGGTYHESYELAMYFAARHTVHDHMEKRGKLGYMFIIGDEKAYPKVFKEQVVSIIGPDAIQADIELKDIIAEVQEKYHLFFIIPNQTHHYNDPELKRFWQKYLPQQNVLYLEDPDKICELIVSSVAICEEHTTVDDLKKDGIAVDTKALAALSASVGGVSKYSASGLPPVGGSGGAKRL